MTHETTPGGRSRRTTTDGKRPARGGPGPDRPRGRAAARRALRREVPCTVGVLADAHDFAAMRDYRSFAFDDHPAYLRHVEDLLGSFAKDRLHTTVVLFDPEEYARYCTDEGIDPDSPLSRSRYTATAAARGGALVYTGQPIDDLLSRLIDDTVRRATWEYAATVLAGTGPCADCGQDIGKASFDRAAHLVTRLLEAAGPGGHHLVCSVTAPEEQLFVTLAADHDPAGPAARLDPVAYAEFITVLAVAVALDRPAGVVLRTRTPGAPDRLYGWTVRRSSFVPLSEAGVFSAYCTDARTGEPVPPEPGTEYHAGFPVPTDDPDPHH
ncbi:MULTISPECIES: hypothetical protein [Streptomyces]|uniref:hypothetical protein n=1 Tax=Streptomyces TaxID=1883 RepID=UPI00025CD94B|nr:MULTISPECIES: hypothetical protein [Streptomyces]AZK93084.1 hypothetical protein B7R87_03740 [Streptomyces tsukubensis]EIF88595.1 hypothetical protein [Streptomyces tsukubensis NRRL18488]